MQGGLPLHCFGEFLADCLCVGRGVGLEDEVDVDVDLGGIGLPLLPECLELLLVVPGLEVGTQEVVPLVPELPPPGLLLLLGGDSLEELLLVDGDVGADQTLSSREEGVELLGAHCRSGSSSRGSSLSGCFGGVVFGVSHCVYPIRCVLYKGWRRWSWDLV